MFHHYSLFIMCANTIVYKFSQQANQSMMEIIRWYMISKNNFSAQFHWLWKLNYIWMIIFILKAWNQTVDLFYFLLQVYLPWLVKKAICIRVHVHLIKFLCNKSNSNHGRWRKWIDFVSFVSMMLSSWHRWLKSSLLLKKLRTNSQQMNSTDCGSFSSWTSSMTYFLELLLVWWVPLTIHWYMYNL